MRAEQCCPSLSEFLLSYAAYNLSKERFTTDTVFGRKYSVCPYTIGTFFVTPNSDADVDALAALPRWLRFPAWVNEVSASAPAAGSAYCTPVSRSGRTTHCPSGTVYTAAAAVLSGQYLQPSIVTAPLRDAAFLTANEWIQIPDWGPAYTNVAWSSNLGSFVLYKSARTTPQKIGNTTYTADAHGFIYPTSASDVAILSANGWEVLPDWARGPVDWWE
jgi:hypothetical protein